MGESHDREDWPDESLVTTQAPPRTATKEKPDTAGGTRTKQLPPYHVIILNDEEHTFDYVIELLNKVFGHPRAAGEHLSWRIHTAGRAVVYTTHKEKAELKRDQVLAYGPDPRMNVSKSSLACYIEPAEG